MIHSLEVVDNNNTPVGYLPELTAFKNGTVYEFKPGVNVIVGENGSGKSTLLKLLRAYLMVDVRMVDTGAYNSSLWSAHRKLPLDNEDTFCDGVVVKADYYRQTFNFTNMSNVDANSLGGASNVSIAETLGARAMSDGESCVFSLGKMFDTAFGLPGEKLVYNYEKTFEKYNLSRRIEYIKRNRVDGDEFTFLIDEPDSSLDLKNIEDLYKMFNFHKEQVQIIMVLHNPILIAALSRIPDVNFIEMSDGYLCKVKNSINKLLKLTGPSKLI